MVRQNLGTKTNPNVENSKIGSQLARFFFSWFLGSNGGKIDKKIHKTA